MYEQIFHLHAQLLKALAHPRRLEILQLLRSQSLPVTDIYRMLNLPQANISQHLNILRKAHVVKTTKKGKQIYYAIAHKEFITATDAMRKLLIDQYKNTPLAKEFAQSITQMVPLTKDPVCGMRVSPKTASDAHTHNGITYYFCASGCKQQFINNPKEYT